MLVSLSGVAWETGVLASARDKHQQFATAGCCCREPTRLVVRYGSQAPASMRAIIPCRLYQRRRCDLLSGVGIAKHRLDHLEGAKPPPVGAVSRSTSPIVRCERRRQSPQCRCGRRRTAGNCTFVPRPKSALSESCVENRAAGNLSGVTGKLHRGPPPRTRRERPQ